MSNMRVVLPSGAVVSVEYIKPITEKIFNFNGKRRRLIEYASDMKKEANGVCISAKLEQGFGIGVCSNNIIVGNLPNEKVQEILKQIGEKGYYDFSQFNEFQKIARFEDLKIGRDYPPYTSERGIIALSAGLDNNPFGNCNFSFNNQTFGVGTSQDIFSSSEGEEIGCADDEEGDPFEN